MWISTRWDADLARHLTQLLRSRLLREWLLITLLLVGLGVATARGNWLWRLDQTLYDIALAVWERPAAPDIVIVAIDNASLQEIGRWPWRRAIHAAMVDKIAADRPRALALDIILSEQDAADDLLAERIRRAAPVVLPIVIESGAGQAREVPPAPVLAPAATRLGLIGLELDQDGLARSVYLREGVGYARHSQLALAMLEAAGTRSALAALPGLADPDSATRLSRSRVRDHWYQIPFVGPPGSYTQVSYVSVLRGEVPQGFFKDKYVLVGATGTGMGDEFPTPVSGGARPLPGVEIHANVLQALQEGIDLRLSGPQVAAWAAAGFVMALMAAFLRLTPRQGLLLTGLLALAVLLGVVALLRGGQLWIAPSATLLVVLSAYPLWSWRRLEAAQGYLEEEFERLSAEPDLLPVGAVIRQETEQREPFTGSENMERRIRDVRTAAERLRNLKRFVADALDSLPDATLVVDQHGKVILANIRATSLFQVSAGSALHGREVMTLLEEFEPAEGSKWTLLQQDIHEGKSSSHEAHGRMLGASSVESEYLVQTSPCHAASGARVGSIVAFIDISALKASEKQRDEVLRLLSHDMRSPQASIITLLAMVKEDPDAMPLPRLLERIGRYARLSLNLADEFLRLARAERLRTADFTPVNLVPVLEEVRDDAAVMAAASAIALECDAGIENAWVSGDQDLLRRALLNLVTNAIKYSPEGTTVRMGLAQQPASSSTPSGEWSMFVSDQGYGIAESDMPRLFGRFSRIQREDQPEVEGIGLGLVFVKTVAMRHGGRIEVHSRTEPISQRGSTFTLTLPASPPPRH